MNVPKQQGPRPQLTEQVGLVCLVGVLVGLAVTIMHPLLDWQRVALKPFSHYLLLGLFTSGPFLIGYFVCWWLVRRKRE
jgi:hypothetical protein